MNEMNRAVELVELFKILGDLSRLRIIRMLASGMESRICVDGIAKKLGISQSAVSQHMRIMKSIRIVEGKKKGSHVYYDINTKKLKEYKQLIDEMFELAFRKCPIYPDCDQGNIGTDRR